MVSVGKFFLIALLGAITDFGLYSFLNISGASVFFSNILSASVAVFLVYLLSKKYLYRGNYSSVEFSKFIAWYVISIVIFSTLISFVDREIFFSPLISKIAVMPFSFIVNYFMGKVILND